MFDITKDLSSRVSCRRAFAASAAVQVLALSALFSLVPFHDARAATMRASTEYTLESGTRIDGDLYAAGERVDLAGSVSGDAVVAGGNVVVSGDVDADLAAAGGTLDVGGSVAGDVRAVGGVVTVRGVIEEDLFVVAGTVHVEEGARVLGSMFVYADHLVFNGDVRGAMEVRARSFEMKGKTEHDVAAQVSESISVTGDARIDGDFTYHAPRAVFFSETATVTGAIHATLSGHADPVTDTRIYIVVVQVLILTLSAFIFVRAFPALLPRMSVYEAVHTSGKRIAVGFVFLFALPIIAIVSMASFLLAPLGLLLLLTYVGAVLAAIVLAPVAFASILRTWMRSGTAGAAGGIFVGAIVFVLLPFVPFVGSLVRFLLMLLTFGSLLIYLYEMWVRGRAQTGAKPTDSLPADQGPNVETNNAKE